VFDFVNRKKRIVQVIMVVAVLPFLFWGVESYRSDEDGYVAIVDGEEIPRREFEQALRDHHERMRSMMGGNFDSSMLDSFEIRNSVLESLIQQRLLHREAVNNGFAVLDSQLVNTIRDIPAFQKDNSFSNEQYQEMLRTQGLSPAMFESRVRQELLLQQLLDGYSENGFVSNAVAKRVMYLSEVQREVSQAQIDPDQFLSQVTPSEAEINDYYDLHRNDFFLPERVRVEYVVLSLEALAENEPISEEAVKSYFDEYQAEFSQPEERQASHILISVAADAPDDEKQVARDKAEDVLQRVTQDPEQFFALAKEFSDDPGSALNGGDLGFFGRGVMVKAFEDEIFQMQPDEIRGLVETDFGFHIIKLVDIKDARTSDLADVREQIEKKLKLQMVSSVFGETAEDFSNIVYEQSDNLQAVAERFELTIQQSDWIDRSSTQPAVLANNQLMNAIFTDDAILDKRNTEAIEVMPDTLVSARVLEHKSATAQSVSIVRDEIVEKLKVQLAADMAIQDGEEKLKRLQAGDADVVNWDAEIQISYIQPQGLSFETLQAVFKADTDNLPAYAGVENAQGGYSLIRISKVIEPEMDDEEKRINFRKQLQQMVVQEEMSSYLAGLRTRYDVTIRQESF
jgi:peptidyl-prolyl cis-trans isomerase D